MPARKLQVPARVRQACVGPLLVALAMSVAPARSATVSVGRDAEGRWQLLRDGKTFVVKGVGGTAHLALAASIGANTVRTWGVDQIEPAAGGSSLLDRAHKLGLAVVVGLWLQHERHGFDYDDPARVRRQRDEVRAAVRAYRHHPAVLLRGLGNEMEGPDERASEPRIWREMEVLVRIIKEEDAQHPVMTVLSNTRPAKLDALRAHAPGIDILGVNFYGGALRLPALLDRAGWSGPYLLTEFGPLGPWEVPHTGWGAPVEQTTREKIATYTTAHRTSMGDPRGRCLGTFCFQWGQKQETTPTWFSMFLPSGEKSPLVDAMAFEFSGRWPVNRSPMIGGLQVPFAGRAVKPGEEFDVAVAATDPEGEGLRIEWTVMAESDDRRHGGDREAVPEVFPQCVLQAEGPVARVRAPERPGAYRLFVTVRDGSGGGCSENVPFLVSP